MTCLPEAFDQMTHKVDPAHRRLDILIDHLFCELQALPGDERDEFCLRLAVRILEEGAYAVANNRTANEAVHLFALASKIEQEMQRLEERPSD